MKFAALTLRVIPWLAAAGFIALFINLGYWQLGRAQFKENQGAQFERSRQAPVALSADGLTDLIGRGREHWQYQAARLRGTYDPQVQFLLDNKTHEGVAGYHVYALLQLEEAKRNIGILVNRGWVKAPFDRRELPSVPLPAGPRTLTGHLASYPRPGLALGPDGFETKQWPRVIQSLTAQRISAVLGGRVVGDAALFLSDDESSGFIRDWQPDKRMNSDKHRGYAIQWFSMATAVALIALLFLFKALRRK